MAETFHALGLHMHQPPGNLDLLARESPWDASQIMLCYERPLKYMQRYHDVGRLHVGFSGILLEQMRDPKVVAAYANSVDIPRMLDGYRRADNIELIGMGYYHPIFPLIPTDDWEEQLLWGRRIMREVFGREPKGFWPPEMAFSMSMIPALVRAGYEYVLVDSVHVKPIGRPQERCTPYQPYLARYDGAEIVIIPRDRDVSNAQESGMDAGWFQREVSAKVAGCPVPRLVTTWSDGENGGWFRQTHEPSGFWGHFFAPFMEQVRTSGEIVPVLLSHYYPQHPPRELVTVETGAWNVASTSGYDFSQWAGSPAQKRAIEEIFSVSAAYHQFVTRADGEASAGNRPREAEEWLGEAHRYVLQAETSCYLFWGDAWVNRVYEVTKQAREALQRAERPV